MPPLIILTIAWMLGIALARSVSPPPLALLALSAPVIGGLFLYWNESRLRFAALNALFLLLGASRLILAQPAIDPGHIAWYNDTDNLLLTGTIIDEPDARDTYTNLRLQVQSLTLPNGKPLPINGLILIRAARYPEYHYGDTLEIFGKPETPPVFETFSYKDYLARRGIHTFMRRAKLKPVEPQHGFSVRAGIYRFKAGAHQIVNRILPGPEGALLNGILLGIQSGIPCSLYDQFNATGASHVIVISGSNISLLVGILLLAGQRLIGKRNAALLALLGVAMYTVLVGADAAVVRAAIMGSLYVLAMYLGRQNVVLNTLFVSALVMTAVNPFTVWDVGFQLSFVATLGLIVLVPILERGAARVLDGFSGLDGLHTASDVLTEALLVTIAAQISTTPLIIYQFGRFSMVSLLTNLLIVPVQPLIMVLGGLATLAGLVYLPLGQLVGWLAWLPLAWTIRVVQWTASFSWARVELPAMPFWLMMLFYLTIGAGVWWLNQSPEAQRRVTGGKPRRSRPALVLGGVTAVLILLWAALHPMPDGKLHVAFLDVGQGDAILITTPTGRQILIDGGPSPALLTQRLGEEMPFWDRSIDVVVNTHPDSDHLTGLIDVINRYQVERVLVSDAEGHSSLGREWEARLDEAGLAAVSATQGMNLQLDETVSATVLNPGPACRFADDPNDHSVVLRLSMGEISFLLTGDIEADVERKLAVGAFNLQSTILKSAHHGSNSSSTVQLLQAVNPQVAVISVGADNAFGHPSADVLQRYADFGIPTLRTDERGTVEFVTDGAQVWLETAR